ncbi:hypothetical protein CFC21_094312 [Triticum aestivum]|uniref:Uncharacterized protein n=2 Tax=Triticum aestivum TaxID=4565 RepID=A0A9R1LMV2_WHEAT|nr:hypothetical protein CFC21_094312 [Triticum aestivum]
MGTVTALWDVLAKAANLAQMSGLHAVMLVAAGASLMRIPQSRRECAKLERCSRRLHALLKWPTGCGAVLLCSELGGPVVQALVDAAALVDTYHRSTLWRRVRSGRSMAIRLRDMRDVVDSYCVLLLFINAHLLLQQATNQDQPPPPDATTTYVNVRIQEANDPSQGQSVQVVSNCPKLAAIRDNQRANDTGDGGMCSQTEACVL